MQPIVIDVIPHIHQRYDTVGDWYHDEQQGLWRVRVSQSTASAEILVAVHELIEMVLCRHQGIKQGLVDEFDRNWKPHHGIEEPGEDPAAPYYRQHQIASAIERFLATHMSVSWHQYGLILDRVSKQWETRNVGSGTAAGSGDPTAGPECTSDHAQPDR